MLEQERQKLWAEEHGDEPSMADLQAEIRALREAVIQSATKT